MTDAQREEHGQWAIGDAEPPEGCEDMNLDRKLGQAEDSAYLGVGHANHDVIVKPNFESAQEGNFGRLPVGWAWSSFDQLRLHPGEVYLYLDDDRGGFHSECFFKKAG